MNYSPLLKKIFSIMKSPNDISRKDGSFYSKLKEKYHNEYEIKQKNNLHKFNIYMALTVIILCIVVIILDSYVQSEDIKTKVFYSRLFCISIEFIVLAISFFPYTRKYVQISSFFVIFAVFGMQSSYIIIYNYKSGSILGWLFFLLFFCGLYPASFKVTVTAVMTALIYTIISYLYPVSGIISKKDFITTTGNSIVIVAIGLLFKYYSKTKNEKEFYSLKMIEESNREISELNERLSELDRIKSNFFANISHEIRTPLTLMITPVEAVLSGGYNYKQDRAFFESIHNNGLRLLSLVNNLLDFSRIDAGRMKMSVGRVNIAAIAASHAEAIRSVCELRGIELRVYCGQEEILIWADREKIDRIMANLLSNAVKFTDSGSITMSVLQDDAGMCELRIEDSGRGIPAERLESIFDRFSQVDSGPSRMFEGTGIGLAMVREYARLHDGTVSVESRHMESFPENHGSVFTVKIPAGKEHFQSRDDVHFIGEENSVEHTYTLPYAGLSLTGTRHEALPAPAQTGSGPTEQNADTILIVEDNPGMHTMLTDNLSEQYRIINANNGLDALNILESGDDMPDLILSDVMMPGMDGYELTEKIRHIPGLDSIPVILLTAKAEPEMKLEGFSKGATDYIVKPFNMRELQSRIKAQLELKSVRDRLERTNRALYAELESRRMRNVTVSESTEIKIRNVLDFINKNYSADISREGLAAAVELNPDHLSRMFNKVTGKRIDSYINELRIKKAKSELIETDKTVLRIAMETGFDNLRTFNRIFKDTEGMTPTGYREKGNA